MLSLRGWQLRGEPHGNSRKQMSEAGGFAASIALKKGFNETVCQTVRLSLI
jgi:hypothetical protein